jgi:hypothetical protein
MYLEEIFPLYHISAFVDYSISIRIHQELNIPIKNESAFSYRHPPEIAQPTDRLQ